MLMAYTCAQGLHHGAEEAKLLGEFGLRAEVLDSAEAHRREILDALIAGEKAVGAIEAKDSYTSGHSVRRCSNSAGNRKA